MTEQSHAVTCIVTPAGAVVVSSKDFERTFRRYRRTWDYPFLPVAAIEIELDSFRTISGIAVSSTRPVTVTLAEAARVFGRLGIAPSVRSAFVFHLAKAPAPALLAGWAEAVKATSK